MLIHPQNVGTLTTPSTPPVRAVACVDGDVTDGYGQKLTRTSACNGGGSVIITITDTCECWWLLAEVKG